MANPEEQDPHKNNMGVQIGGETDYQTWDWRKILVAITGSVNTDGDTAAYKLPGTSSPQTFYDSATYYDSAQTALNNVHTNLKVATDRLVGIDNPTWTGDAADAFKGLMDKTLGAVKTHADPLTGPPSYAMTLNAGGDALTNAINTANTQNYNAAAAVIDRWNNETVPDVQSVSGDYYYPPQPGDKGSPPWYDYNGTTIVMISHYPDIDHQLTRDMRGTLQTLVQAYRGYTTDMPEPTGQLPTPPGDANPNSGPLKVDIPPIKQLPPPKQPPPPKQQPVPKLDAKNPANGGVGPDGKPLTGPGAGGNAPDLAKPNLVSPGGGPLGPDGKPLKLGPNGQPLGPDGKPLTGVPNLTKPNGLTTPNLVNTPNGPALVGPDGKTLLDPKTGKPLIGPDGKPLTLDTLRKNPALIPPPGGFALPGGAGGFTSPNLRTPAFKAPAGARFGKPPNMDNLVGGGPPAKPGFLASEGEAGGEGGLKPGAKEFGAAEGSAGGRGEPIPMGGGGGMGGAGGEKDRDRTTWLVEDEEVWGAETALGFGVLGR